jgi:energy-coupling factor transporter ATP-binding protein EcfA2
MSKIQLEKLYFGKDDAETDIAKGGLLKQGFLRTRGYEEALAGTKTLIIGRKGSGKSAICLMLNAALSPENRVSLVTPDEISAEEARRFQFPGIAPEQSKFLIWRYVFAVQIAKFILATAKTLLSNHDSPKEVNAVRQFLIDNKEIDDLTVIERFWKVIERLKGSVSLEAFGVKLGAEVEHPSPGIRANDQLELIENHLVAAAEALQIINQNINYHLLVDQIEKIWSNDRDSDLMVVGLLLASKHVRQKFNFVICTVFLRTDIYEKLQFQDRDKFRGDEFHIDWHATHLLDLILARAQASCGAKVTPKNLWMEIFPRKIADQDITVYLIGRTLMRPRDVIQLCNACRDTAKTNGNSQITEKDIKQSLSLYSNWKLSDLQNEWTINYPFLADIFVLLANSSYFIKRTTFEARLELIKKDLSTRFPSFGSTLSADAILSTLYSIGLLGVIRHGEATFYYQEKTERRIQPKDCEFIIHPCFRNALQSTSAMHLNPFESTLNEDNPYLLMRFQREARIGQHEIFRGPRGIRFLKYISKNFYMLRAALEKSPLPTELCEEVRTDIAAMQKDVEFASDSADTIIVNETATRVHRHITQVINRLKEQRWLTPKSELLLVLEETAEQLERFLYSGSVGDYGDYY